MYILYSILLRFFFPKLCFYCKIKNINFENGCMGVMLQNKSIDRSEYNANKFTLKCLCIMTIIIAFTLILNILDIFIIDDKLMYISFFSVLGCLICAWVVTKYFNNNIYTKYILALILIIFVTIIGVFLTYHTILITCFPILCSAQYKSKKMIYYSFVLSVISMFIIVMGGYFFGLCDANMLALTSTTMSNYVEKGTNNLLFTTANPNPWGTLPLYYFFPRCLVMYATIPLISHISDVISKNAIREQELKKLSETDSMTQLYNKNKYLVMVDEYYPTVDEIGVVFWDINDLKLVNDTMGHEYGDYLISAIAASIVENVGEATMAYRVGGDEFVVIMENGTKELLTDFIEKCKISIERKNIASKVNLSAAAGYAIGAGKDVKGIVSKADDNMYIDKENIKRNRKNMED